MGKIKNLLSNLKGKCPLKISIRWEWNYKSKKKRLKERIQFLELQLDHYRNLTARVPKQQEAKSDE